MRTIGLRAKPQRVTFAVYCSDKSEFLNVEDICIPAALSVPDGLKYLRNNLLDVLNEYEIEQAGLRTAEPIAKKVDITRVQIEGVIQESFASSPLKRFYVGPIASISRRIGIKSSSFLPMVNGLNSLDIENWQLNNIIEREAMLTALGAVNV